jgi:hypothetical protein
MDRFRRTFLALSLGLTLVTVPTNALATTDVTYAISGVEYAATTTVGSFAGVALAADDYGTWQATIVHGALPTSPLGTTGVSGGSFALNGNLRDLAGAVNSGGVITLLTTSPCGKQTYSVVGSLTLYGGAGWAGFSALLTHYRIWLWGRCITYAATVKGYVAFHLT